MRALLESLYREHRQGLFTLAMSIARNQQMAEDAVHEAFVKLYGRTAPPAGDPAAYVFAAVRNAAIDQLRRRAPCVGSATAESMFEGRRSSQPSPDGAAMDEERDRIVQEAIEQLPDAQREAVVLRLYGGLTFEQMAQAVGEPLSTVSTRYSKALEQLRKALEMKV